MSSSERDACSIRGEIPELYFCPDMRGYGWCFRKGNFLNIGLGRLDAHGLPGHVANFLRFLKKKGKVGFDVPSPMAGHAYLLLRDMRHKIVDEGVLLTGDAAGLAYSQSGEGIRPAIESGLMAADAILAAKGKYSAANLESYRTRLELRFGKSQGGLAVSMGRRLPVKLLSAISRQTPGEPLVLAPLRSRRLVSSSRRTCTQDSHPARHTSLKFFGPIYTVCKRIDDRGRAIPTGERSISFTLLRTARHARCSSTHQETAAPAGVGTGPRHTKSSPCVLLSSCRLRCAEIRATQHWKRFCRVTLTDSILVRLPNPREREIPTCYGGEFGPDLDEVAALRGIDSGSSRRIACLGYLRRLLPRIRSRLRVSR